MIQAPCRIRHIDLQDGVPALPAEPGYASVLLIFRWGRLVLGSHCIEAKELPLPVTAVTHMAARIVAPAVGARLLDHGFQAPLPVLGRRMPDDPPPGLAALLRLEQPLHATAAADAAHQDGVARPKASLIICTRARAQALMRCLASVWDADELDEILVVDNSTGDPETRKVVAAFPSVRYLVEPRAGLSAARNAGLAATSGEIVLFTDDDVEIEPGWAAALLSAFGRPEVMAATGLILPAALDTPAQLAFEYALGGFDRGYRAKEFDRAFFAATTGIGVPVWLIGSGANMAFRRAAFARVGLFDERLGAGASGCSEDSELWYRLLAAGYVCRYEPGAVVRHHHRADWPALTRQLRDYTRGHVVALFVQYWQHGHAGELRRALLHLPRYYLWLVKEGLRRGFGIRQRLLPVELAGWLAGLRAAWALRRGGRGAADA